MEPDDKGHQLRRNEKKWTKKLMDAGYTVVPAIILKKQRQLGLDAIDLNILMQLARHWWESEKPPFPSKRAMAECIGVDLSTIRRHVKKMEGQGLIRREERRVAGVGQDTNVYHFDGLIERVSGYADEELKARGERHRKPRQKAGAGKE